MPNNENRSSYIGHTDCPRPVSPVLVKGLWVAAFLLLIAAIVCTVLYEGAFVSLPFLIFGPTFLIGYLETRNKRAAYSRYTDGRVVDKVVEIHGRSVYVLPIIEYEADVKTYRAKGNRSDRDYVIGDVAWVYYNPDAPAQATQEFVFTRTFVPVLGAIAWGLGIILLAGAMMI